MMSAKQKYRTYCIDNNDLCIFAQDWWNDAVSGDCWDVLLVEKGGRIFASMPYCMHKKFGLKIISQQPLTPYNGMHISYPPNQKSFTRLSYEKEVMSSIILQLEDLKPDYYCHHFCPLLNNWLPFYWAGFDQTTRYTYLIQAPFDLEKLWTDFTKNNRNNIRKAQKIVSVRDDLSLAEFIKLNRQTFARQNMDLPYSEELIEKIYQSCLKHKACKMLFAEDSKGQLHAALFIVWDARNVYALMSGGDNELRKSGAGNLLFWETIKFASETGRSLDFLGSMLESVEHSNRSFAAALTPYFQISKMSSKWKMTYPAREIYKRLHR